MRRIIVLLGLVGLLSLAACTPAPPPPTATPAAVEGPAEAPPPEAAAPDVEIDANAPVKVVSVRDIRSVLGERDAIFATLSPDGAFLAYYLSGSRNTPARVCWFAFQNAGKTCADLPDGEFRGAPYQLQWSPDSSRIALTENPVEWGNDADIWVINLAEGSVTNLTDDGVVGSWRQPTGTPSSVVDYLPMWNPSDGKIYFWRFQNLGEFMQFTAGVYRIDPAGGDPEMVVDVSAALPRRVPMFQQEFFFLDGPSAISPDGNSIAALLAASDDMGMTSINLYKIDLAGGAAPVQLMAAEDFSAAVPEWNPFIVQPGGVAWTSDSKGILAMAASFADASAPFAVFYHVDTDGGAVTPVTDFSQIPSREDYFQPMPGTEIPARWFSPWTGSLSPQGDKLLMVNNLAGVLGLMSANLPPTGALPAISGTTDSTTSSTASRSSRSADGKITLYGLLAEVQE